VRRGAISGVVLAWTSLLACASSELPGFTESLPPEIPDLSTWEKITGRAELAAPHRLVEYELFVGPTRRGLYAVVRYRTRITDPVERKRSAISTNEKLQWDVEGGGLRRYECVPLSSHTASPCRWKELAHDTPEFLEELPVVLSIYGLHSFLLHERDAGRVPEGP
jgi:hypothetical protein